MNTIESYLIGIVSGLVSSFIITQIYRQIDKKQNRFDYINELLRFADSFENALFRREIEEIEDEYIDDLYNFVLNNILPIKKKWVKLRKLEKKKCDDFILFYYEVMNDIMSCRQNIQRIQKGEIQYIQDVKKVKFEICTVRLMELLNHKAGLLDMRKNYMG